MVWCKAGGTVCLFLLASSAGMAKGQIPIVLPHVVLPGKSPFAFLQLWKDPDSEGLQAWQHRHVKADLPICSERYKNKTS